MEKSQKITSRTVGEARKTEAYKSFLENLRSTYGDSVSEKQVYVYSDNIVIVFDVDADMVAKITFNVDNGSIRGSEKDLYIPSI